MRRAGRRAMPPSGASRPELVEPAIAVCAEAHELAEDPLAGRLGDAPGSSAKQLDRSASSSRKPSSSSSRTALSRRSGSSSKTESCTTRIARASMSARPPYGSIGSPPATGTAIAFSAKSRVARSSSMPSCSGVKSTVRPSSRATRQAPCRSESGNGAPPDRRAYERALRSGSRQAMSRSLSGASEKLVADRAADDPRLLSRRAPRARAQASVITRCARSPERLMPVTIS